MLVKRIIALLLAALLMTGSVALAQDYQIHEANTDSFNALLMDLLTAYETPSPDDAQRIEADVSAISAVNQSDGEIAQRIASHWQKVYLDKDYPLCIHSGGEYAEELAQILPQALGAHAFVVLGYELTDGEMAPELMGRCDAAAAAARSFPGSILVCSGGATGENNPEGHTEAGLMKQYLVETCGIDENRIFIDEAAMTTAENALNTFGMLRANGIETMTIITSSYHQRWGQAIYNAVSALYDKTHGYSPSIVGNYCYDIEPSVALYKYDAQIAVYQLAQILNLPQDMSLTEWVVNH